MLNNVPVPDCIQKVRFRLLRRCEDKIQCQSGLLDYYDDEDERRTRERKEWEQYREDTEWFEEYRDQLFYDLIDEPYDPSEYEDERDWFERSFSDPYWEDIDYYEPLNLWQKYDQFDAYKREHPSLQ